MFISIVFNCFRLFLGLAFGGLWGCFEGLANPDARTARLKLNCVLNSMTRRGPFLANNVGMVALFYNFIHGGFLKASGRSSDIYSAMGSAATAGLLFRISSGPKSALLAAAVCSAALGSLDVFRNWDAYSRKFLSY